MSRVYDFGLGGQFPDSSTNFPISPSASAARIRAQQVGHSCAQGQLRLSRGRPRIRHDVRLSKSNAGDRKEVLYGDAVEHGIHVDEWPSNFRITHIVRLS